MRRLLLTALALSGCSLATAQGDGVLRCQGLQEASARLACYDALYPPRKAAMPSAPSIASPAPQPASASAEAVAQFGLPQKPKPTEVEAIESSVAADFQGWGPNDRIRLLNGQVWEVVDSSSGTITPEQRKVKVRRGVFGSFFLDFEGLTKSPKVRRVQ